MRRTSLVLTIPLLVGSLELEAKSLHPAQPNFPTQRIQKYPLYRKRGIASWYGKRFHGKLTASGEIFDRSDLTAAHPSLPLGTYIKVTNLRNGRSVVVKVNDRLPPRQKRIVDLSYSAAHRLGLHKTGIAPVEVQILG